MIDVDFDNSGMPKFADTIVNKAANLMTTQEGKLYYNQAFGIDLNRFIDPDVLIQTETFKSYVVERMADNGIFVTDVKEGHKDFDALFTYILQQKNLEGLVTQ